MAKKKNKVASAILVCVALVAVAVAGYFGYSFVTDDINGNRNSKTEYNLVLESADFQYDVGQKLMQNNIIKSDTVWSAWMDRHYPDFKYINGEYMLNSQMSYEEIAQKLQDPDISHTSVSVCIPEGYTVFQIAEAMENNNICSADDFLNECKDSSAYAEEFTFLQGAGDNKKIAYELEGFLFPATYDLAENSQPQEVITEMLEAFSNRISDSWTEYCNNNNMTLAELVSLASVVEKETLGEGVAEKIASVFVNRLNKGQQLQSDVTIDYGNALREAGFSDEVVFSYNTYKCKALPSGPICNPGVANIDAVVNHADTDYMYFFSYNNGEDFYFTDNYSDFQAQWAKLGKTNTQ